LGTVKEIDKWWAEDMENNACEWMAFLLIEIYFLIIFPKTRFPAIDGHRADTCSKTDVLVQAETKTANANCWKLGTVKEIDKWWAADMEDSAKK
jgi:hypothetical protein